MGLPKRTEREGGHLIYAVGGTLCAIPFDLPRLETRGTAVVVQPRLLTKASGAAEFVVSMDGTLAYVEAPDTTLAITNLGDPISHWTLTFTMPSGQIDRRIAISEFCPQYPGMSRGRGLRRDDGDGSLDAAEFK